MTTINIFYPRTGWSIASKLFEMKCETAFKLTKKFDSSGKKYSFTMSENVVNFLRSIGNPVFNLFFNFCFNDNFLEFSVVNNFETSHMYSRSIK